MTRRSAAGTQIGTHLASQGIGIEAFREPASSLWVSAHLGFGEES